MMPGMRRSRLSSNEWRAIFRQQRASGLTVKAFCQQSGVALSTFSLWRRKLGDRPRGAERPHRVGFAEVKVAPEGAGARDAGTDGAAGPNGIELHLAHGRRIVVRPGFDRRTLRELLAALETES